MSYVTQENTPNPVQTWEEESATAQEQAYRAGAYQLLASLLRDTPRETVLDQIAQLTAKVDQGDELIIAMSMLGLAARDSTHADIDDEFHALFIGLGRGELVPYGSWYLTGFLLEKPLAILRDDLALLGYERTTDTREPEDHIAALCEVMALLINDERCLTEQAHFFETHLAPWAERFFDDLSQARHAVFYRAVGRFGLAFIRLEQTYLSMKV